MTGARSFALLEALRPPPGWRTSWALGTTYSLDLIACAAAMAALDGASLDEAGAPLHITLRALRRAGRRTRVFAQQGCIGASTRMSPKLIGMFDSVVRRVAFPLQEGCFHPKVWIARHEDDDGDVRWVLVVSSKNLSCDNAWEAGVALAGTPGKKTNLPPLRGFVEHVAELGSEGDFAATSPELDRVEWVLPSGVTKVRFAWHPGDGRPCAAAVGHPLGLPREVRRVLVVSPFVDRRTVRELGNHFRDASSAHLVSGRMDLSRALANGTDVLGPFRGFILEALEEAAEPEAAQSNESSANNEEDDTEGRGLHAKLIATTRTARDARLLIGSLNMTTPAWGGRNCEAWVLLEGSSEVLFEPLWKWHEDVAPAEFREPATASSVGRSELDETHAEVCASTFRLDESSVVCRLTAEPRVVLDSNVEFLVGRATVPGSEVRWHPDGVVLPSCKVSERSQFVAMRLRIGDETRRWLQVVELEPSISLERDSAALRELVSPERLPSLLRSILDDGWGADDAGGEPSHAEVHGHRRAGATGAAGDDDTLSLEQLLSFIERAWRDETGHGRELVQDAARLIDEYRGRSPAEGPLRELFEVWDALREELA